MNFCLSGASYASSLGEKGSGCHGQILLTVPEQMYSLLPPCVVLMCVNVSSTARIGLNAED